MEDVEPACERPGFIPTKDKPMKTDRKLAPQPIVTGIAMTHHFRSRSVPTNSGNSVSTCMLTVRLRPSCRRNESAIVEYWHDRAWLSVLAALLRAQASLSPTPKKNAS